MANRSLPTEAKVGIFVALVVVGLAVLTTQINQNGFSLRPMDTYYIRFKNVSGLLPRTPVEYAGIRVGHVEDFRFDGEKVSVKVKVESGLALYEDSRVSLVSRGLLGEKIIMIENGGKALRISPGGVLEAESSSAGLEDAVANFNEMAGAVKDLLKGGGGKPSVRDIVSNINDLSEDLRSVVRGRRDDLDRIVENMRVVSESLRKFLDSEDQGMKTALEKFSNAMDEMEQTVSGLREIVARVERGEGSLGKLLKDETTVNKMNDALDGVSEFVGQIKQLEIGLGFRTEYMGHAKEPIAVTSFRFRPAFDKYFLLEFTDGPIGFAHRRKKLIEVETSPPGTIVTTSETTSSDSFSITAMFARRFWDLTLKAGIIRSSGGFGAEYHLFRDHLDLGFEAFDFSREENPHLRLYAKLHFLNIFYLNGGVDDLLHRHKQFNFFGGLGFLITDDDIRKLFGIASLAR